MSTSKIKTFQLNRRSFLRSGAIGAAGLMSAATFNAHAQDMRLTRTGNTVATRYGQVRGLIRDDIHQFWGIPYGASTAGENRFMPPQPPASWSGVRDQFQIGGRCYQEPGAGEPAAVVLAVNRQEEDTEDCLKLNVFTPGTDNASRPVMVWLHGGGHSAGSGNYLIYDGTPLAKKEDVVVVAVTHRLNIFGYMHLADIGGEKWANSTNVGTQDLIAALRWVQDNIAAFGGDPDRVTIFGQSGGATKVSSLMAIPSASGLFHRAIAQSGSRNIGAPADATNEDTERFLARLGINSNNLDRLQSITPQQIQEAFYTNPRLRIGNGPVVDGNFLPAPYWDRSAPSYSANVPFMKGSTETENGWQGPPPYEMAESEMLEMFTSRLANGDSRKGQELIDLYQRKYPGRRNRMLWLTAESDNTRRISAQEDCRMKYELGSAPSYLFLFDWHSPVHDNRMGSYHCLEIPFVFYNVDVGASMTGADQYRYELAHVMSAAWAAFARTGNPNHADMPTWEAFSSDRYQTMRFGDNIRLENDPNREERLALAAV